MYHWLYALLVLFHGLAHMVYVSFAQGWVIPERGGDWIGSSWLLSGPLGNQGTRSLGSIVFSVMTALFVVVAIGLALRQPWSTTWLGAAAIASSLSLLLFWDGSFIALTEKGAIGLLINITLLIGLYFFHYPTF